MYTGNRNWIESWICACRNMKRPKTACKQRQKMFLSSQLYYPPVVTNATPRSMKGMWNNEIMYWMESHGLTQCCKILFLGVVVRVHVEHNVSLLPWRAFASTPSWNINHPLKHARANLLYRRNNIAKEGESDKLSTSIKLDTCQCPSDDIEALSASPRASSYSLTNTSHHVQVENWSSMWKNRSTKYPTLYERRTYLYTRIETVMETQGSNKT